MELEVTACQLRGVWHRDRRHGFSIYLRIDINASRIEVWRKRRVFLAMCCPEFEDIDVQQYLPGDWEAEIMQLGRLAVLASQPLWRRTAPRWIN